MATSFFFDNREIQIPDAYSRIESGIQNPALNLAFGNTLVIDTGSGKFWGGGSGVGGQLLNGRDSFYTFDNVRDFQRFVRGGLWWLLAGPLFLPGGGGVNGISSLTYVRAATTTAGEIAYTFSGGGSNGGTIVFQLRDEGFGGNGVLGDETRATSTITVTNAGADGDSVQVVINSLTVASYTVTTGDDIAAVVAGLVTSAGNIGLVDVSSSTGTTLVIQAIRGQGISANSITPTVNATGTAAASATQFSGGVTGTLLTRGYAARMVAGTVDTSKFRIQFWRGTFKGLNGAVSTDNIPFDGINEVDAPAELISRSPEFNNIQELIDWANTDTTFNSFFKRLSSTVAGDGSVNTADLTANVGFNVATGGTETFSSAQLDAALNGIGTENYDFILADDWGENALSANNLRVLSYVTNEARIKPDLYVGGGRDNSEFAQAGGSIPTATTFNSQFVTVVHGGAGRTDLQAAEGFRDYDSIYKAATILGREAGLEPQVPLTFKSIAIERELHNLTTSEITQALNAGVLTTRLDGSTFDVVKGVNSLQNNDFLINQDGTTSSKQLRRIVRQINKELVVNAKEQLLKNPNGTNRNTLSTEDVKAFVEAYLTSVTANDLDDDLIISFERVNVTVNQDAYEITYFIVPNFEVSFLFFTGFIIDPQT